MANFLQNVMGQYNLGNQMWGDFMKQIQGIQSGAVSPQELPQFKQMQTYLEKIGQTADQNLMRELTARGVTGGALEQAMRQSQEQRQMQMGNIINQMYGQVGQMVPQVAQQGMDPFWKMMQLWSQRKGQHSRENLIKTQMWMEGIGKGLQAGASAVAGGMGAAGGSTGAAPMGGSSSMSNQFQQYPWTWGNTW